MAFGCQVPQQKCLDHWHKGHCFIGCALSGGKLKKINDEMQCSWGSDLQDCATKTYIDQDTGVKTCDDWCETNSGILNVATGKCKYINIGRS